MTSASSYSSSNRPQAADSHGEQTPRPGNRADLAQLPQREATGSGDRHVLHGAPPVSGQTRVLLHQQALVEIDDHARSDLRREVGGVLLGHAFREGDETVVEVKAALPAFSNDHGPVHFTFTADAWSQIHRDRASRYPQLDIVGWFHTHPGLGVFYSADDVIVHSAAFVMPWHVGLVIDPLREEAAFFGWSNDTIKPLKGFHELTDEPEQSAFPWQAVESAVWDETYEEHLLRQQRAEVDGMASTELPPVSPWLGLLTGVLGIILSLGLLFGGVLPLYLHSTSLEGIVVSLADNNLQTAAATGLATCPDPALRIYAPAPGSDVTAGTILTISGVAQREEANSYALEIRPGEELEWWPIHSFNRDVELGRLAEWDTTGYTPARYQLRLVALNNQGRPLAGATPCIITFDLMAAGTNANPQS